MGRLLSLTTAAFGAFFCLVVCATCSSSTQQAGDRFSPMDQLPEVTTAETVDGTSITFGDFGGQPTVLWFWTPH